MSDHMDLHEQNKGGVVRYDDRYDEYAVAVPGSEAAFQIVNFCPWCGVRLPMSQRDKWFDDLEAMGIDPFGEDVPSAYRTSEWRCVE